MNIKKKTKVTASKRIQAAVTNDYDFTDRVKFGKNRYRVMYTGVNTEASAESMFNDFRFQISVSNPYDDADYAKCYGARGVIKIIKGQKVIHKAFYFNADDMDVENTEWCDEVVRIALSELEKINGRIEQRIIHNSRKISADATVEAATFKNDRRLSTTSERYKGYLIVLDRGGDGYNVYDKHRELEDAGYPSREAAKKFIDELVDNDDVYSSESIEDDEDDIKTVDQEYDSANTSINSTKLPAIYNMVSFPKGAVVLDYGGGKFDNAIEYLDSIGCKGYVYDPYNRSAGHNREVIKTIRANGGADITLCSNVLNVIKEPEARQNVLENIKKLTKPSGKVYITVYEGRGDGAEGPTKSGYQLNRKTAGYLDEVKEVFPEASRKGKLICASYSAYDVDDEYIDSSTDITAAYKLWMGKYKSANDNKMHKVYFEFDTSDFEEAEQEFEDIIPEPYSYARLLGTAPYEALLQKDGFEKIQSSSSVSSSYWYFTRHGVQPGSVPKYVNILDIVDKPEGSYFLADGVILTNDLRDYDIKERKPEDSVTSSTRIKSKGNNQYTDVNIVMSSKSIGKYFGLIYYTPDSGENGMEGDKFDLSDCGEFNSIEEANEFWNEYLLRDKGQAFVSEITEEEYEDWLAEAELQKDWESSYKQSLEDSVTSSIHVKTEENSQYTDEDLQKIAEDIEAVIVTVMKDEGFDESEAKMYSRVTISDIDDNGLYIEVGAEVGYESLERICSECDKVIQALPGVDEDSYFEPIEPGLAGCYVYSK